MLNKIYNKIKKYIQENFSYLCVFLFLLFITLYPVNYYIITGGGVLKASNRVTIKDGYKQKGSFNMAYVSELRGTIFTYLLSYVVPSFERDNMDSYKASDNESSNDINFRNSLWLRETNNNAIFVSYTKAGKKIDVKEKKDYIFYISDESKTNLKVGDEILEIDNLVIDDTNKLKNYVNTKKVNDKVIIKVKRNGKISNKYAYVYKENNELYVGITIISDYSYKTDPKVSFSFRDTESGPSGGLMITLQIYNMLVKKDITGGRNITGTGTIDRDGEVGEIDGVKYKLAGAVKNKSDIFLVPSGRNYKEALKEKKKKNYKIKIIAVENFDDAINKLNAIKN